MLVIFTPKEKARQIISEKYGPVTYEALGENESLGGVITTRNLVMRIRSIGQTYEFGSYGRPVLDPNKTKIDILNNSKPITKEEKIRRRKRYIEYARISGPGVEDYSKSLGEWGDNPRTEPRTRKVRDIYVLSNNCEIPIWICDVLEPVLNWGEGKKVGIDTWLRENYQKYLGLPLYKIPPLNFADIDITDFPKIEKELIEQGKLDGCSSLAEQNIILLQEVCKLFDLNPVLIDQRRLRKARAYRKGINRILENIEELEKIYGKNNLFRVECPQCGKYIYNIEIEEQGIKGMCEGKVRTQRTGTAEERYKGCGNLLEKDLEYLYTNAMPNGKILTSIYMSNSDVGIFFPDFEFVPENVVTGELEKMILTTGEYFDSGIPKIIKTGWFTMDGNVENIFGVLDFMPFEEIKERFKSAPTYRRIDIKQKSIESQLLNKLRNLNPPTDPRIIADVVYSLDAEGIDLKKLNWNGTSPNYICRLLRCLGQVRDNKVVLAKPKVEWEEDYQTFMDSKYLTDNEIRDLRGYVRDSNSKVRTVMEIAYLSTLVY